MLPPIYEMDDYSSCLKSNNKYCKARAIIEDFSGNTEIFQQIQKLKDDVYLRDPTILYRAICFNKEEFTKQANTTTTYISNTINQQIQHYNISSKVDVYTCTDGNINITNFDVITLILLVLHNLMVFYVNWCDWKRKGVNTTGFDGFLSHFSFYRNWKIRTNPSRNEDYQKLLSIQGLRFYFMLYLILLHVSMVHYQVYVENSEFLFEHFYNPMVIKYFMKANSFFVIIFFVISSWISTIQVYNVFEKYGELSLKHVGIIIINRYFRFTAAAIFILVAHTSWKYMMVGPLNFDLVMQFDETCNNHWLYSIICTSNLVVLKESCFATTWSLSADFQMYVINVLIIYAIFKFKLNEVKTYGLVLIFYCVVHGLVLYLFDNEVVFNMNARTLEFTNFQRSTDMVISYMSTFSIASSSCIGMIMGVLYHKYKNATFDSNQLLLLQRVWFICFFGLPNLAITMSMYEGTGLIPSLLGSLVRPLYSLGMGIGMLGTTHNIGGIIKKVLELKYVLILSNFTFCTYICHIAFCFMWHSHVPPSDSNMSILKEYLIIALLSLFLGIYWTLAIEEPCLHLQKKLLPQVKKYEKSSSKTE